ncbi:hypothetical protein [Endozoicomonas sp. Mp262]|uniref:hypothetical protein n=1 Tax=Endozoicomonas sp. Mp262 TaxID=2919499 RepID=UPI0021D8B8B7
MISRSWLFGAVFLSTVSLNATASAPVEPGVLELDKAVRSDITLYTDKALVRQVFNAKPNADGILTLEGIGSNWREDSLELEYSDDHQPVFPEKIWWRRGGLDRDSLYSKLVGKAVELVGGGLNVPVQGELLVYDNGVALVQGHNGRQYVVDWNDSQGIRLASKEPVFTEKDYIARLTADFGKQATKGSLQMSYLTPSLRYSSQYRLTREAGGMARLERHIILMNDSNVDYKKSTVRLVAGDMNTTMASHSRKHMMLDAAAPAQAEESSEQRVGEILVTKLPEPVRLKRHSSLQLTHYKQDIDFEKFYMLDIYGRSYGGRAPSMERPRLVLAFKAEADLASGRVEMYEKDKEGFALQTGGAWLPETIKGDWAKLTMGEALAVRVERNKIDSQQKGDELHIRWQATIHNGGNDMITFRLSDRDRSLLKLSDVQGGKLRDTSTIQVSVPANSKKKITYSAVYGR